MKSTTKKKGCRSAKPAKGKTIPAKKTPTAPKIEEDWEYGVGWHKRGQKSNQLEKHLYCALWGIGTMSVYEHRKAIIRMVWPEEVFSYHEWTDRRLKSLCDFNFVTWTGPAACVAGHTRILNPLTGEQPTIAKLYERGEAPVVMTLKGPAQASVPFIKGYEMLYEVRMDDGSVFVATAKHRVLSPSGYRHVGDLHVGDTLLSWQQQPKAPAPSSAAPILQESTSDTCPSTRAPDALSSRRKAEGSRDRCSACSCLDDEQPRSWLEASRSSSPSQGDAQGYKEYDDGHSGGRGSKSPGNHPCLSQFPPSNSGSSPSEARTTEACSLYSALGILEYGACSCPLDEQSQMRIRPEPKASESVLSEQGMRLFCDNCGHRRLDQSCFKVQPSQVVSITGSKRDYFYDITVPAAGHYFAEGAIHHNSGKSSDAAILALEYWMEAPHRTAVMVCSTTKEMLRRRIWAQIVTYFNRMPKEAIFPPGYGELIDASCMIRWAQGDMKNGIFGFAIADGPVEQAVNNIIGIHTDRILVILDEMQEVKEAVMKAIPNLLKNPESKMLGMGNPNSFSSLLCRYSEPVEGWNSIEKFAPEWETHSHGYKGKGKALFFDGRKSPAVLNPEWGAKNPWMINQEQIDNHLYSKDVNGNMNDPDFMTQSIGWPPTMGTEATVLDAAIIQTFRCTDSPTWTSQPTVCAALDPAFNGGDKAILQFGKRGLVTEAGEERWVIGFTETITVPIDAESQRPIHYQISDFCREQCEKRGVKPDEFAIAAAGEGGGLKSIMEIEWGPVNGIEEGGAPSDRVINERGKTAKESYDTRASELCFGLRDFALGNGIRGLPEQAMIEACARQTFYRNGKWCAEPKTGSKGRKDASGRATKGFKERLGYSPDEADSCQILVEHCRMKGAVPSFGLVAPARTDEWNKAVEQSADDFSSENYRVETEWSEYANA